MANDCLQTKLKKAVSNNELVKVGVIRFYVNKASVTASAADNRIRTQGNYGKSMVVVGNGKMYASLSDAQNDNNGFTSTPEGYKAEDTYLGVGTYYIDLSPKYGLTVLNCSVKSYSGIEVGSTSDVKYCSGLTYLMVAFGKGDIADFSALSSLTNLLISESINIGGNISSLASLTNLTNLDISGSPNAYNKVYGDISSLAPLTKLTNLKVKFTNVEGSIDDLAQAQASSRSNGSTLAILGNNKTTYKSNGDGTGYDITFNTTKTITFNGAGGYSIS